MNKVISALLVLIAVFLAYAFAASGYPAPEGEEIPLGEKLVLPFKGIQGVSVVLLALGVLVTIGALFFLFSKSRSEKAEAMSSTRLAAKFALHGRKSKGLEVGFLASGVLALAVLAMIVFGTVKAWFDETVIGALGSIFILQLLFGLLFFVLFIKKKNKAVLPFIPAIALFLLEVAAGAFGLIKGLK